VVIGGCGGGLRRIFNVHGRRHGRLKCGGRETRWWWRDLANRLRNGLLGIGRGDCVLGAKPAAASGLRKRPALDEGQVQGAPEIFAVDDATAGAVTLLTETTIRGYR